MLLEILKTMIAKTNIKVVPPRTAPLLVNRYPTYISTSYLAGPLISTAGMMTSTPRSRRTSIS